MSGVSDRCTFAVEIMEHLLLDRTLVVALLLFWSVGQPALVVCNNARSTVPAVEVSSANVASAIGHSGVMPIKAPYTFILLLTSDPLKCEERQRERRNSVNNGCVALLLKAVLGPRWLAPYRHRVGCEPLEGRTTTKVQQPFLQVYRL